MIASTSPTAPTLAVMLRAALGAHTGVALRSPGRRDPNASEECEYVLAHSGARAVLRETPHSSRMSAVAERYGALVEELYGG